MHLLPTEKEIESLKAALMAQQARYDEALRADKPFNFTRQIFVSIKELEKKLEKITEYSSVRNPKKKMTHTK